MVKLGLFTKICILLVFLQLVPAWAQESLSPPHSYRLDMTRLKHIYQSWNNCGPATLTMGLGYFGYPINGMGAQEAPAAYLKPTRNDGNVSFWQMADYVNNELDLGITAIVRRGGNLETLKQLLADDFPIIVGNGLEIEGEGWVGHFALVIGYDDDQQVLLTYDSIQGHGNLQGLKQPYATFEPFWTQFNNVFLVLYPPEREADLRLILGDLWDQQRALEIARDAALARLADDPDNAWAQFNLGEALTGLKDYAGAAQAFDQALAKHELPFRVMWYMQGLFEAYYQTGQFDKVLQWARFVQDITPDIEDMNYYRGLVYAAQGDTEAALERFDMVLDFNPNYYPAAQAKAQIEAGVFVAPVATEG